MKVCPVCGDATFDDQSTCFGCLHRYEDADAQAPSAVVDCNSEEAAASASQKVSHAEMQDLGGDESFGEAKPQETLSCMTMLGAKNWICPLLRPTSFRISLEPANEEAGAIAWSCSLGVEQVASYSATENKTDNRLVI